MQLKELVREETLNELLEQEAEKLIQAARYGNVKSYAQKRFADCGWKKSAGNRRVSRSRP